MEPRFFATPAALRRWLEANHARRDELLVGFRKVGSGRRSVTYQEALDEALCFGWIDGVRRRLDDESYAIRFTPRRARSHWSAVNLRRIAELEKAGRVRPAGLAALRSRDPSRTSQYSNEQRVVAFDRALAARFRADADAWAFFQAQPPGYRRVATWYVVGAKREETRLRRLAALIDRSRAGERLPQVTRPEPAKRSSPRRGSPP